MNEAVVEFVERKKAQVEQKLQEEQREYRDRVVSAAGLYQDRFVEVSKKEYNFALDVDRGDVKKDDNGTKHYYLRKSGPANVTDEEFAAIEAAFSEEELELLRTNKPKKENSGISPTSSNAAGFFRALGIFLLCLGFIISIITANVEVIDLKGKTTKEFSFTVFMSTYVVYAISGAFCFCAAELFNKLTEIVNLLKEIKRRK